MINIPFAVPAVFVCVVVIAITVAVAALMLLLSLYYFAYKNTQIFEYINTYKFLFIAFL